MGENAAHEAQQGHPTPTRPDDPAPSVSTPRSAHVQSLDSPHGEVSEQAESQPSSRSERTAKARREHQLGLCDTLEPLSPQQSAVQRRRWQVKDKEDDTRVAEVPSPPGTEFYDANKTMFMPQVPQPPPLSSVIAQNIGALSSMGFQADDLFKFAQSLHKAGKHRVAHVLYEEAGKAYDRMLLKDGQLGGNKQADIERTKFSMYATCIAFCFVSITSVVSLFCSVDALATLSRETGNTITSEKFAREALNKKKQMHGDTHPETISR